MAIIVRPAVPDDAVALAAVNIRSIREVCGPDYDDAAHLDDWCANKTPENFRKWMDNAHQRTFTGLLDGTIAGVGLIDVERGYVHMLYLVPEALGRGLGRALLRAMEQAAAEAGHGTIGLHATITARAFYERQGFTHLGEELVRGKPSYKMEKTLA
jgi:GNAT superfamily N-acetyltransferase